MESARPDDGELDQLRRVITVGNQDHGFCMLLPSDLSRLRLDAHQAQKWTSGRSSGS